MKDARKEVDFWCYFRESLFVSVRFLVNIHLLRDSTYYKDGILLPNHTCVCLRMCFKFLSYSYPLFSILVSFMVHIVLVMRWNIVLITRGIKLGVLSATIVLMNVRLLCISEVESSIPHFLIH